MVFEVEGASGGVSQGKELYGGQYSFVVDRGFWVLGTREAGTATVDL